MAAMGDATTVSLAGRFIAGPAFGAPRVSRAGRRARRMRFRRLAPASSRVWFTLSHGTLNEIYYPTIDWPQTRDMELLFTDGETFFHEEKRDIAYEFEYIESDTLAVRVTGSDPEGDTVTKEFVSDPHHSVVLMHVKITGDESVLGRMKCYALLAPHLNGGGIGKTRRGACWWRAGGSCWRGVDRYRWPWAWISGFTRSSCGFVGESRRLPGPDAGHEDGLAIWAGAERQYRGDRRDRRVEDARVHRSGGSGGRASRGAERDGAGAGHAVRGPLRALPGAVDAGGDAAGAGGRVD